MIPIPDDPVVLVKLAVAAVGVLALLPSIAWPLLLGDWRGLDARLLLVLALAWFHTIVLPATIGTGVVSLNAALTALLLAALIHLGRWRLGLGGRAPQLDRVAHGLSIILVLLALSLGVVPAVAGYVPVVLPLAAGLMLLGALRFGWLFALAILPTVLIAGRLADATFGWKATSPVGEAVLHLLMMTGLATLALPDLRRVFRRRARHRARKARYRAERRLASELGNEMRRPLEALLSIGGLLAARSLPPAAARDVEILLGATARVRDRVDDLLALRMDGAGAAASPPAPFELRALVDGVAHGFEALARPRRVGLFVEVAGELPDWLEGDAPRIAQVLRVLVRNAVVFIRDGEVRVAVASGRFGDQVRVEVRAVGTGLDPETMDTVFRPLARGQVAGTALDEHGGLGLPLARRLAEAMGGSIGVTADGIRSSRFWVSLPLPAAAAPSSPGAPPSPGRALSILLADGDMVIRYVVSEFLLQDGHRVLAVADGGEAVTAAAGSGPFDAVLLAPELHGAHGRSIGEAIRRLADGARADVPIVAVARPANPQAIRAALAPLLGTSRAAQ